jgi:hypothetical protein
VLYEQADQRILNVGDPSALFCRQQPRWLYHPVCGTSGSKPLSSSGESSANRASAQQLQTLDRAGLESINHFSANPNDGTGLP